MVHRLLLLVCCLKFSLFVTGQKTLFQKAEALYNSPAATDATDSQALHLYIAAIQKITAGGGSDSLLLQSYCRAGILHMLHGRNGDALNFFHQTVQAQSQRPHLPDSLLFLPLVYSGSLQYELNDLDSAMWFYQRAEELLSRHPTLQESERLYNKQGALYYEMGDYRKSIVYFSRALQIVESHQPRDIAFVVNYRNNIASALRKLGYTDSAINVYKSLLALGTSVDELRHNIGMTFLDQGRNAEALQWLQKIRYTPLSGQSLSNHLALASLRLHQVPEAKRYLDDAVHIYKAGGSRPHDFDHANSLWIAGDLAMEEHAPPQALHYYQAAIIELVRDFRDTSIYSNPGSFQRLSNSFVLFEILIAKARAFAALGREGWLHALDTYDAALKFARQLQMIYHSDEARLFLNNKVTPACREAVDLGVSMTGRPDSRQVTAKLFEWCEGNKASVLQAALYSLQLESITGLPKDLLKETKTARALLSRLNLKMSLAHDSASVKELDKLIADQSIRVASLEQKLEQDQNFRRLLFAGRDINLDSIQKNEVSPEDVILSYFYTGSHLLCFYITSESYGLNVRPLPATLNTDIQRYRHELDRGEAGDRNVRSEAASRIFNILLQPMSTATTGKKHLVIIPYNAISYIPFESLPSATPGRYVLQDLAVSYRYSISLPGRNSGAARNMSSSNVLALAPFAHISRGASYPVLPASGQEIASLKGRLLYDSLATKENFISLLKDYSIVHLATHAKADDADGLQSNIAFFSGDSGATTPALLFEQEIYHLDMQYTRLVILSACETGGGQLVNGEGIMSLSRAFSYAGCPAVVTSMWRAEDQATSYITRRLHHYLSEGRPVDQALQAAKLDYLNDETIPAHLRSPAFWAHLVLIGDYHPVSSGGLPWGWIIFAICLLLLAIVLLYKGRGHRLPPGLAS